MEPFHVVERRSASSAFGYYGTPEAPESWRPPTEGSGSALVGIQDITDFASFPLSGGPRAHATGLVRFASRYWNPFPGRRPCRRELGPLYRLLHLGKYRGTTAQRCATLPCLTLAGCLVCLAAWPVPSLPAPAWHSSAETSRAAKPAEFSRASKWGPSGQETACFQSLPPGALRVPVVAPQDQVVGQAQLADPTGQTDLACLGPRAQARTGTA